MRRLARPVIICVRNLQTKRTNHVERAKDLLDPHLFNEVCDDALACTRRVQDSSNDGLLEGGTERGYQAQI